MAIVYIILGVIVLLFLLQMLTRLKMWLKKGKPAPAMRGAYAKAAQGDRGALFYFYSNNCGACKPMTPIIEDLAKKQKNVFKINVSNQMDLARQFGVMGTPSTVLVRQGKISEFLVGPQSREKLQELLV